MNFEKKKLYTRYYYIMIKLYYNMKAYSVNIYTNEIHRIHYASTCWEPGLLNENNLSPC